MLGASLAAATAGTFGGGLYHAASQVPLQKCGGALVNRWPVKVATDADAVGNKINVDPGDRVYQVSELNQQVKPGPLDSPGGRMDAEKRAYTVHGYLSYFTMENGPDGDQDYHVVIAGKPGDYTTGKGPATGDSMVVEFPNPPCFGGKNENLPHISALRQQIAEARATFENHLHGIPKDVKLSQSIPVTVTGVGFFDKAPSNHLPTGHSRIWPDSKGKPVVLELHPVTQIEFDKDPEVD